MLLRRLSRNSGWIPQYHGAWPMINVPPLLGIIAGGWRAIHVLLLALWWSGYFLFYAASVWLRSRMRPRYWPPVRAYGIAVALLSLATAAAAPYLLRWVPLFLPLVAAAAWAAWRRSERSLANGVDTVLAASLMLPVCYDAALTGHGWHHLAGHSWHGTAPHIWAMTAFVWAYFTGTILYVKTNVRERGSRRYLVASIAWHAVWCGAAALAAAIANSSLHITWWHAGVWLLLTIRATAVPLAGLRGHPISVKVIGLGEVLSVLLVAVSLLAS
ncbi:YwiC-like family protein [Actinobaculum sp. 352]|uniref:YwiC-like family protein n=1 Tax=Actinobaculum sp. 352 TaxID=2490946 RepID=UPI000F7E570E|nr:YwiC-like family protein [Actinobaculum sp. 352]RTE49895.1 hypothetical protein EKN07_05095 [Actinobaculum sp. 352]